MAMGNIGLLGAADLVATTLTNPYSCQSGYWAPITVTFVNRNSTPVKVRLAISTTTTPAAGEYIEYDTPVLNGSSLVITTSIGPTQKVVAWSDSANVGVNVNGVEDSTT